MLKIAFHPCYAHSLPEGHRFPMLKYELIPEQLLYEGCIVQENLFEPGYCSDEVLLWTHDANYLQKLHSQELSASEQRKIGFPQSVALTQRELMITQGTMDCCLYALEHGIALNVAGGTHHAFADRGEGFCLLNDMAVASNWLLKKGLAKQILIIDLDVHQGNGTAKIFESDNQVYTFSMHGAHNYPFHKEQSNLDVPLLDGTDTETYLGLLQQHLPKILKELKPDFAFYLSGVDILETDKFGKLKVSMEGCKERDAFVLESLKEKAIPVTVAMGGGYSPDVKTIVDAHCNTFRLARDLFLILLIICSCFFNLSAQAQFSMRGLVLDSISKQPLAGINLFLSHTSIGTTTDQTGHFILDRIPQGKFELVISSLNYETRTISINTGHLPESIQLLLKPTANELQEVIVEPYDEDGWDRWGRYFNAHFIGNSALAADCKLINPDVVKFRYSRKNNTIRAFSREKLIFDNKALGYRILYLLTKFEYNLVERSFYYSGYPQFEEMKPKNADEKKRWDKKRKEAYQGSIMHFMRALYNNQLEQEGFEIHQVLKVDYPEYKRASSLFKAYSKAIKNKEPITITKDSLEYYKKASKLGANENTVMLDQLITKDDLVEPTDTSIDATAQFMGFTGWLRVTYQHKRDPIEYARITLKRIDHINSDINLPNNIGLSIYPNGTYFFGYNLFIEGYWSWWEKLSTHLPTDYLPELP